MLGVIERLFGTFQDKLINEMNLWEISNLEDANNFLHREFLQDYNKRFTKTPQLAENASETGLQRFLRENLKSRISKRILQKPDTFTLR